MHESSLTMCQMMVLARQAVSLVLILWYMCQWPYWWEWICTGTCTPRFLRLSISAHHTWSIYPYSRFDPFVCTCMFENGFALILVLTAFESLVSVLITFKVCTGTHVLPHLFVLVLFRIPCTGTHTHRLFKLVFVADAKFCFRIHDKRFVLLLVFIMAIRDTGGTTLAIILMALLSPYTVCLKSVDCRNTDTNAKRNQFNCCIIWKSEIVNKQF